jgi:hypothetical protein
LGQVEDFSSEPIRNALGNSSGNDSFHQATDYCANSGTKTSGPTATPPKPPPIPANPIPLPMVFGLLLLRVAQDPVGRGSEKPSRRAQSSAGPDETADCWHVQFGLSIQHVPHLLGYWLGDPIHSASHRCHFFTRGRDIITNTLRMIYRITTPAVKPATAT